jgi:hypothetical protein
MDGFTPYPSRGLTALLTQVAATTNTKGNMVARLAAKKAITHHMYSATTWEKSNFPIADITAYIPIGNIFKLEIIGKGLVYHGNNFQLKSTISVGTDINSHIRYYQDADLLQHQALNHFLVDTSAAGMALNIEIASYESGSSNGDRQVQGQILLWDYGPASGIPDLV